MDVLVPAFLLALLSLAGDRLALLMAALGEQRPGPIPVALAAGLGHAVPCLFAGAAAVAIAPHMPPRAQAVFLAVSLAVSGIALFWPAGGVPRWLDGRFGTFVSALFGGAVLGAGGATPLFVLALGLGGAPWLAATGGALGAWAIFTVAALAGTLWQALPRTALRLGAAVLLTLAGLVNALSAAGLL